VNCSPRRAACARSGRLDFSCDVELTPQLIRVLYNRHKTDRKDLKVNVQTVHTPVYISPSATSIALPEMLSGWFEDGQSQMGRTAPGFRLIPPESNVMPLPTKASGWASGAPPLYLLNSDKVSHGEIVRSRNETHIPNTLAGSDIPLVTERKVRYATRHCDKIWVDHKA
jgi:hypothetical protein